MVRRSYLCIKTCSVNTAKDEFYFRFLLQFKFIVLGLQVDHLTRHQEDSDRALQERILKLEGQRIQLEEVHKIIHKTKDFSVCKIKTFNGSGSQLRGFG